MGGRADGHERIQRLTEQSHVDLFYLQRKRSPFSHVSIHAALIIPITAAVAAYPQSKLCDNSERVTQRDPEAAVGEEVEGGRGFAAREGRVGGGTREAEILEAVHGEGRGVKGDV